jgi:hypothetical protein
MISPSRRQLCGVVLALILAPTVVHAQPARGFGELRSILKVNDLVIVTDGTGQKTKGRIIDLSVSSLVVSTPNKSSGASDTRTFTEGTVRKIKAADPLRNGALIGAATGTGLALWDYLIDPSEPGNAVIFTVAIGLGSAIGAGVDALTGQVLYVSQRPSSVGVSPLFGKGRRGVRVDIRF